MIVIEMKGGLGNQLFQYALFRNLELRGKEVLLDKWRYLMMEEEKRIFELNKFQNKRCKFADYKTAEEYRGFSYKSNRLDLLRSVFRKKRQFYLEKNSMKFYPEIFDLEDAYLSGYWQCDKYFEESIDKIKDELRFPDRLFESEITPFVELRNAILNTQSVSIHFRRGDYLDDASFGSLGCVCTERYYKSAIDYYCNVFDNPVFYLFSDQPDVVPDYIQTKDYHVVNSKGEWDDLGDMYLMGLCKGHIIANSSFSWWSCFLGNDDSVVCPNIWVNGNSESDIIRSGWIRMNV